MPKSLGAMSQSQALTASNGARLNSIVNMPYSGETLKFAAGDALQTS
ncbi:MAG TPA: hypothetical protein VKC66_34620 [Xanthobacteraceae bacterium]|nr:hypothetical protein [Xanthobacteraceae bacterium]